MKLSIWRYEACKLQFLITMKICFFFDEGLLAFGIVLLFAKIRIFNSYKGTTRITCSLPKKNLVPISIAVPLFEGRILLMRNMLLFGWFVKKDFEFGYKLFLYGLLIRNEID